MYNKGFTLVELLAVVIILSLLALITSTAVIKVLKDSKEELYEKQKNDIIEAAEIWGADNLELLPDATFENQTVVKYLNVSELIANNYLDNVIDPRTNTAITDSDLRIKIVSEYNISKNILTFEIEELE